MTASTTAVQATQQTLTGVVERITFHNPLNGFTVAKVKVPNNRHLVAVVGVATEIHEGESVTCEGEWHKDRNHGVQFKASQIKVQAPQNVEGMQKYLASGMTNEEILADFPYLTEEDIRACLQYAADREHQQMMVDA